MELTAEVKKDIDSRTYKELLAKWRFASAGEQIFQGESGEYYKERMAYLRAENPCAAVEASKELSF